MKILFSCIFGIILASFGIGIYDDGWKAFILILMFSSALHFEEIKSLLR